MTSFEIPSLNIIMVANNSPQPSQEWNDAPSKGILTHALRDCFASLGQLQLVGLLTQLSEVTASTLVWMFPDTPSFSKEDYWYRACDFERFKREVIEEAIYAGHECPRAQYQHIRRSFQDEQTLKNTELNLVRTKQQSLTTDTLSHTTAKTTTPQSHPQKQQQQASANTQQQAGSSITGSPCDTTTQQDEITPATTPSKRRHQTRRASDSDASVVPVPAPAHKKRHRRSVSFDFEQTKQYTEGKQLCAQQPLLVTDN